MRTVRPVLSLPMRNWNRIISSLMLCGAGFSAYLWGIETWKTRRQSRPRQSSQPTYEELKRGCRREVDSSAFSVLSLPMRNWNLIRQLRSGPALWFSAYLWGIETRWSSPARGRWKSVLSLPMRNWNLIRQLRSGPALWFSAYLWGIETCSRAGRPARRSPVLSLPMRNWNHPSFVPLIGFPFPVLSLPMRNWNFQTAVV